MLFYNLFYIFGGAGGLLLGRKGKVALCSQKKSTYMHSSKPKTRQIRPDQMDAPTPDTEWRVKDLLHHMLYELSWTPDIVMGETIEVVGDRYEGDLFGDNPQAAWWSAYIQAREAVRRCDPAGVAHLSYGDRRIKEYLFEAARDQLVHTWDLGQALGVEVVFGEPIAAAMLERTEKSKEELADSGLFAGPVAVPKKASAQTKLLALLGRSTNWQRSAQLK